MWNNYFFKNQFWFFLMLMFLFSCSNSEDIVIINPENKPVRVSNYCAMGASTASMSWQAKVAEKFADNYKSFAIGGTRWAHTNLSVLDLSDNASANYNNFLMTNQLARLLKYKEETGYNPEIITIMCGLNDAANGQRVIGDMKKALSYNLSNTTPEQWYENRYVSINSTVYGSLIFVTSSLIKNFPNSKIVILTLQQCNNGSYNNANVSLVNEALINVAEYYKLDVIDVYNKSGIIITDNEKSPFLGDDQLHPNELGQVLLTNFVSKEMDSILAK